MRRLPVVALLLLAACSSSGEQEEPVQEPNTLSFREMSEGWRLLFDGETTAGWRGFRSEELPAGWEVVEGTLARTGGGGDIVTEDAFQDFVLRLEWKVAPGGNSGIFFRVDEEHDAVWRTGPEMQVLDDALHPDGRDRRTAAGSNYALHGVPEGIVRPAGEWNQVELSVVGQRVRHVLNGMLVVDYVLESEDWESRVAASKFSQMPDYGRKSSGHIALQDHGDPVWYRSIRIREL